MNKSKMKSIIAGVLTAAILATSVPTTVFAAEKSTVVSAEDEKQAELTINYLGLQANTQNNLGGFILAANATGIGTVKYRFFEVINNKKVYIPELDKILAQINTYKEIINNYKTMLDAKIKTNIAIIKATIAKYQAIVDKYINQINAMLTKIDSYVKQFEQFKATIANTMNKINGYINVMNKYLDLINKYFAQTPTQKTAYAAVKADTKTLINFKYGDFSETPGVLWIPLKTGNHTLGVEVTDDSGKIVSKTITYNYQKTAKTAK